MEKDQIIKEIKDNLKELLSRPLMTGNLPFNENYLKKKRRFSLYLKLHLLQNRIFSVFSSFSNDCRGIVVGHLAKVSQTKEGKRGDFTNIFLKNLLNENQIKTAELLIPTLKEKFLLWRLLDLGKMKRNQEVVLSYVSTQRKIKLNKEKLKKNLLSKIEEIKRLNREEEIPQYVPNIKKAERKLDEFTEFICSDAFVNYFFGLALGVKDFLERAEPKFVIVNSLSGIRERLIIFVAGRMGIKTLFIPHGMEGARVPKGDDISTDIRVSRMYNPEKKRETENGREVWRLGPICFGYLVEEERKKDAGKPALLYGSQAVIEDRRISKEEYISFLNRLFRTFRQIQERENLLFLIKMHPREDPNIYKKALKRSGLNAKLIKKPFSVWIEELPDFDLKMVIFGYSTLGMEAIILKKALVSVVPDRIVRTFRPSSNYKQFGIPLYTEKDLKNFGKFVLSLLKNKEKRKSLAEEQKELLQRSGVWLEKESLSSFLEYLNKI